MFYRGYVLTQNKKCIEKFKNRTDFKTLEQVQSLPEYAGILAPDAILVDIDDMEQSEILFKMCEEQNVRCRILKSRSGMHFLFKNSKVEKCFTKTRLACGLVADIKSGSKIHLKF
jgi:putative DNA primase/helicase